MGDCSERDLIQSDWFIGPRPISVDEMALDAANTLFRTVLTRCIRDGFARNTSFLASASG